MIKLTDDLREEFDYILLDCPAGIEQGFKNAIAGADKALVVTTPEVSAIRDADRIIGLLEANDLRDIHLIINRLRPDMIARGDMMSVDGVTEILAVDLSEPFWWMSRSWWRPIRESPYPAETLRRRRSTAISAGGLWGRKFLLPRSVRRRACFPDYLKDTERVQEGQTGS